MANKKPYSKKSVNGELNSHLEQSYASGSEQSLGVSLVEYNQPESSPYESPIVTIRIGCTTYRIPLCYIQDHPHFSSPQPWEPHYTLSEVDEEVGHTIVHYLCTGNYETLRTASEPGVSQMATEYRRSMLVYQAARKYDIYGLQTYAKKYIEMFSESMSVFGRMEVAREIYSQLPQDETWLTSYIEKQLQIAFSLDTNIFQREEFYDGVGRDPVFDKAVMRMVVNIYSEVLSRKLTGTTPEEGVAGDCAVEDGALENGVAEECGAAEDGVAEDGVAEDGVAEEGAVEEAINLGVPSQPSGTALRFEWDHWTSSSKLEASFSGNSQWKNEKATNSLYPETKADESGGFSAGYEGIKSKKKKDKRKKKSNKDKDMEKEKEHVEELAEPVPELRAISAVGLV